MSPKRADDSSQLKVTDMFRPVTQAVAQNRVDAGAKRDRQLWNEQAAERQQLEEQLAAHQAEKRRMRMRVRRRRAWQRRRAQQQGAWTWPSPGAWP